MACVTRRPQAETDILEIWDYIAADSVEQAVNIYNEQFPPDLSVEEATVPEIKDWINSDQQPYRS